jgi:LPS export ABC transporter permease LptG/LPS export ABC transporter permease LptF
MRKLDKLLFRAVTPPFLIALSVLTFIVFLHEAAAREGPFNLSELLITQNASPWVIVIITAGLLPGILFFTLPLSYLIGILIGISGLSGESQITALRACGVPIRTLLRFILILGTLVGIATGILTLIVFPRTNDVMREVKGRISLTQATSQVQPRVFNEDFPNIVFYVGDLAADRLHWSGVFLSDSSDASAPRTVLARSGSWIEDSKNRRLQLHLEHGASFSIDSADPSKDNVSSFASTDIPISLNKDLVASQDESVRKPQKTPELTTSFLWKNYSKAEPAKRIEYLVELNRRIALPFSVIPFALVGLSLGINSKKGGRTSGFALSLVFVLLFYILFSNGINLASIGTVSPWLGAFGADILLTGAGLILLVKAERTSLLSRFYSCFPSIFEWRMPKFHRHRLSHSNGLIQNNGNGTTGISTKIGPKILDHYLSREFFIFFFWSIVSCGTLFVLFTLFDLLDDIIRNSIPIGYVLAYFVYLTPQILMWVVPMSVLLAVLISLGILEKNSEITAIKAGGWSLYRIAVPVLFIATGMCAGLFLMQDYVLPVANIRQDSLRDVIKGRPHRLSAGFQRKWIIGDSNRIYNYHYFDGRQDSFVDLNVYEIDLNSISLRQIHAARARIESSGTWKLQDGWIRDYRSKQNGLDRIIEASFYFPEKAGYFENEIFQPKESSKWTYPELKRYINDLGKSGYNAVELKVELYKKISFPLSCMVMALIGVPFSFSTGKKGAFFGIGMSVAIAMCYWGVSGLFESMGDYGMLVPALAAWAPNLLFGATGLVLLFTIRT